MHNGQPTVRLYDSYAVKYRLTPNGQARHHATYPTYAIFLQMWDRDKAFVTRHYDPVEIFVEHRRESVVVTPLLVEVP